MADIYLLVTQYSVLGSSIIHYCLQKQKTCPVVNVNPLKTEAIII